MTDPLASDPLRLGMLLRQTHAKAAHALSGALEPLDITGRHFGVLVQLHRLGESTQKELIALTGSDKAGMARTIDALVAAGWVDRRVSPADRRVSLLTLTPAGTAVALDARERAIAVGDSLFAVFSPAERDRLAELLQRFVDPSAPAA